VQAGANFKQTVCSADPPELRGLGGSDRVEMNSGYLQTAAVIAATPTIARMS
jgi:hypothetical protein